ncbi:MAG: hypothetical protein HDT42_06005 [Ruminococcaceae bacterium]|nr:hypothetical protein [Oscillospiraceae bacterium]
MEQSENILILIYNRSIDMICGKVASNARTNERCAFNLAAQAYCMYQRTFRPLARSVDAAIGAR